VVLSRERFRSDGAHIAAEPRKLPNKLLPAPLCIRVPALMVDAPHASTEAVLSDCTSGLSHANENKTPGTGTLEESV